MKTVTFQGTENQFINFGYALDMSDNDLPQKVEIGVYVVDAESSEKLWELTDEEFKVVAENEGRFYTLQGFQQAFNFEEVSSSTDVIRFINLAI